MRTPIDLIRQYFPKQTDFRNISDREIRRVQDELNHRLRKNTWLRNAKCFILESVPTINTLVLCT